VPDVVVPVDQAPVADTSVDAGPSPGASLRIVNALTEDLALVVCTAPLPAMTYAARLGPEGVARARRSATLPLGPVGAYGLRVVAAGQSCDRANALFDEIAISVDRPETRWLVVYDAGGGQRAGVQFPVSVGAAGALRLRWLHAVGDASAVAFEYDVAMGNTLRWTANLRGAFGFQESTDRTLWFTTLPGGAQAAQPRAFVTAPSGPRTVESDPPLPRATGSFTLVLTGPVEGSARVGRFLLLDEAADDAGDASL